MERCFFTRMLRLLLSKSAFNGGIKVNTINQKIDFDKLDALDDAAEGVYVAPSPSSEKEKEERNEMIRRAIEAHKNERRKPQ